MSGPKVKHLYLSMHIYKALQRIQLRTFCLIMLISSEFQLAPGWPGSYGLESVGLALVY